MMTNTIPVARSGLLIVLSSAALALPACRTTNDNIPPAGRADSYPTEAYPAVTVERPLQQFVAIDYDAIRVDHWDGTTPMSVDLPVRSTAYEQMSIQYRVQWFDADGRALKTSGWSFRALEPGLQTFLEGRATTSEAAKFRYEIRSAR